MSRNERPAPHLPQFRSAATIAQFTIWLCFTDERLEQANFLSTSF